MRHFTQSDIQSLERFYRANFINSLTGFKSASLIGTVNDSGQTNLAIFSSIVHIGSDPALVGYVNRPRKAAPHTLANIEATGEYTINHILPEFIDRAHQSSAKYPDTVSEFDQLQFTPQFIDNFRAPFVMQSRVKYGLTLQQIIPITLNETFLVIGKIEHIHLDPSFIGTDGFIDLQLAESICSNGIDSYYQAKSLGRFEYAKADSSPKPIS
jgi:flavin reductase (DIM6/NTAB) family NADH-FMN oxidoreductase RutF